MTHAKKLIPMFSILACLLGGWLMPVISAATPPPRFEDTLLSDASGVLTRVGSGPAEAIPRMVLDEATAIAVFPSVLNRPNFSTGNGVISAREHTGHWSLPAIVEYEGKLSTTIDRDTVDIILIAMTAKGRDVLAGDDIDQDALTIVAGALSAEENAWLKADIVAYVQFGSFFGGLDIKHASVCSVPFANSLLYGVLSGTSQVWSNGQGTPATRGWTAALKAFANAVS